MNINDLAIFVIPGLVKRFISRNIKPSGSQKKLNSYEFLGGLIIDSVLINYGIIILIWGFFIIGWKEEYIHRFSELNDLIFNPKYLWSYILAVIFFSVILDKIDKKFITKIWIKLSNKSKSRNNLELEYSSIWNQFFDNPKAPLNDTIAVVTDGTTILEYGVIKGIPDSDEPEKEIILEASQLIDIFFKKKELSFSDLNYLKSFVPLNSNRIIKIYEGSEFVEFVNTEYLNNISDD